MISLSLGKELKSAGLTWFPKLNDYFAIPDRGLDDRLFVLSDMMSYLGVHRGKPVVTFHGAMEWSLDYIAPTEVVWMPREDQLRRLLGKHFNGVTKTKQSYRCDIQIEGRRQSFHDPNAADAYAKALLFILQNGRKPNER